MKTNFDLTETTTLKTQFFIHVYIMCFIYLNIYDISTRARDRPIDSYLLQFQLPKWNKKPLLIKQLKVNILH